MGNNNLSGQLTHITLWRNLKWRVNVSQLKVIYTLLSLTLSQFGNFSLAQVQISSLLACYRPYGKRRVSNRGTKGSLGWVTYGSKPLSFYPSVTNAPIIIAWNRMEMYQQTHRLWFNGKLASKWSLLHYWIPRALHNFVRVTSRGYWSRHNVTNFQLFFNYIFINRAK